MDKAQSMVSLVEGGYMTQQSPYRAYGAPVPAAPKPKTTIANPGLFSFASTTLILSLFNMGTRGIAEPNVVVGMAIFCGGLAQLLAGMWEFPRGNGLGASAFTSYGAFWMSYATILLPGSGVIAAYGDDVAGLTSALGIYLTAWTIVTLLFFVVTLRKNIVFIALFGCLTVTFGLLAAGQFTGSTGCVHVGGGLGVITACIAYYAGLSELLVGEEVAIFRLPLGTFKKN